MSIFSMDGLHGAYADDWPDDGNIDRGKEERSFEEGKQKTKVGNETFKRARKLGLMGRADEARKDALAAIQQWEGALGSGYDDMSANEYLFQAHYFLGDTDKAMSHLQTAIELDRQGLAEYMKTDEYREYGARFRIAHLEAKEKWPVLLRAGHLDSQFQDIRSRPGIWVFDVDGTLIKMENYAWDVIDRELGTEDISREMKRLYASGMLSYKDRADLKIRLYQYVGLNKRMFDRIFSSTEVSEGAVETLHALRDAGKTLALVSGSFDNLLEDKIPTHIFSQIYMHHLVFGNDGSLEDWSTTPYGDGEGKAKAVHELRRRYEGESNSYVMYMGDNDNDLQAFEAADITVACNPKTFKTSDAADVVIQGDMRQLLDLLR